MVNLEKPFKDREEVKADIRRCDLVGGIFTYASFAFAALGVIGDALNTTLGLEPMSWFLLAIIAGLNAIIPYMHWAVAKHLYGIESELLLSIRPQEEQESKRSISLTQTLE